MKRPAAPRELTEAFLKFSLGFYRHDLDEVPAAALRLFDGGPACWLFQFDEFERPCAGRLEAVHLIGRQRIRNTLFPLLSNLDFPDTLTTEEVEAIVQTVEWDVRLGVPGCEGHHRRLDGHLTPALSVPAAALPERFIDFTTERGFETEAERKFDGYASNKPTERSTQ